MSRLASLVAAVVLFAVRSADAHLVPINFSDDPPIQKLTRSYTQTNWHIDAFGQCAGIDVTPAWRMSAKETTYYAWAVADDDWDCVVYGIEAEVDGVRQVVPYPGRVGHFGSDPGDFAVPKAVAFDTVLYDGASRCYYVYVADHGNSRVERYRLNWDARTLTYVDVVSTGDYLPQDVACVAEGGQRSALLVILDQGLCRIKVLRVHSDLSVEEVATYGQSGSSVGQFSRPTGLCVCRKSTTTNSYAIYVSDPGNYRMVALNMAVDYQGQVDVSWSNQCSFPGVAFGGVASDGVGLVYVAAENRNAIYALTQDLSELCYTFGQDVLSGPRDVASIGDELAVSERWADSSGVQYFRIVPDFKRLDCNGLFDATLDSCLVSVEVEELNAHVDIDIMRDQSVIKHLVEDSLAAGVLYNFWWDGRDYSGKVAVPDQYSIRGIASFRRNESNPSLRALTTATTTINGTEVSASIATSATWDKLHEPYVLTDTIGIHGNDVTLTIQPGVRVMFHDSAAAQGINVHPDARIVAVDTTSDSIYFMPHRKMADGFVWQKRGWWGGVNFSNGSHGGRFRNCVFENGGGSDENAAVHPHPIEEDSVLVFDNCHFRGSAGQAIAVEDGACDDIHIDHCLFGWCNSFPLYQIEAPDVAGMSATCSLYNNGNSLEFNGIQVEAGLYGNKIDGSCTWHKCGEKFFYVIGGDNLVIRGSSAPTLTIEPGVSIRVASGIGIEAGSEYHDGSIIANGGRTTDSAIVFEGVAGETWNGIHFRADDTDASSFRYCVFRDGVGKKEDGYYPMLYCDGASPTLYRCTFENAVRPDTGRGVGIYINEASPSIVGCKFSGNEVAILESLDAGRGCSAESCHIEAGEGGLRVMALGDGAQVSITKSNIIEHSGDSGVVNFDASNSVYARHNWWGEYVHDTLQGSGRSGSPNDTGYGYVDCDSAMTDPVSIWGVDAQVCSIVRPHFTMKPGTFVPMGVAQNNCCIEETIAVSMRITRSYGACVYFDSVRQAFPAFATDSVRFDDVTLDTGIHVVVFKVHLPGDEMPQNDSIVRTVQVIGFPLGWTEIRSLPASPSDKPIKDGGCMAYDDSTGLIFASKGNKTGDFYAYDANAGTWATKESIPLGVERKQVYRGAAICSDGNGKLYLTKGNNRYAFWQYDAAADTWIPKPDVPPGRRKKLKKGTGLAWATRHDSGGVYLLKGYSNEFWRYDPQSESWDSLPDAPVGGNHHSGWKDGSWLVADPRPDSHKIYAFKGTYHEFYTYDTDEDTWSHGLVPMPVYGDTGGKKAKDGSCAAWCAGKIYAFKGGNAIEFWRYLPDRGYWQSQPDIPRVGRDGNRRGVKAGGALAGFPDTTVYAFKGNKTREFWHYNPGQEEEGGGEGAMMYAAGGRSVPGAPLLGGEEPLADGLEASRPRWNWQGTTVCYSRTDTLTNCEQIYQCQYPMSSIEQKVIDMNEDCEEPVYSPDGQYIAFQVDDDESGFYQLYVTMSSDTGPGGGGGPCGSARGAAGTTATLAPQTEEAPKPNLDTPGSGPVAEAQRTVNAGSRIPRGPALFGPVWQITNDSADHCYPEWSPDGEWLCYERDDANGYTQVWRVPAFGGTEQQLTFGNSDHYLPEYLNATDIVFTLSPNTGYDKIAKVNDSTHQVTVLTPFSTDHANPSPSWNGYDVAAEAVDTAGNTQIVHTAGPAGETWLTSGDADITEPDFGQDNQTIFAVHWTGITSEIVWVDAQNGGYTAVTDDQAIRDNPDAKVDTALSTALAVYEREAWSPENLLLGGGKPKRKHGSGVYLSKFRKRHHPHEGLQGGSLGVFALDKAKPNPATNRVTIRWQVPVEADVSLRVYNTAGQLVKVLANGKTKPGAYTSVWNGTDAKGRRLANGVYFYALDNGAKRISRKVVLTE